MVNENKISLYTSEWVPKKVIWEDLIWADILFSETINTGQWEISLKIKDKCDCSESEAIYCGQPKLKGLCQQSLPQPSQEFINKYIEKYNKDE